MPREYFYEDGPLPPPSCAEIAAAGHETLCELSLLSMQDATAGLGLQNACGLLSEGNPIPTASNPACVALSMCGATIPSSADALTATFVQGLHFSGPCALTLSYFESKGLCGGSGVDAGRWPGVPPVVEGLYTATSGASYVSSSSESFQR